MGAMNSTFSTSRVYYRLKISSLVMVFKLAVTTIALAVSVANAALTKRVTCPDGNVTANEAVSTTS